MPARLRATRAIRERPAVARDLAIPGHREGDSIACSRDSYIATPVERQFRYVLLAKVPDKNTDGVVTALVRQVQHLPRELRGSSATPEPSRSKRPRRLSRRRFLARHIERGGAEVAGLQRRHKVVLDQMSAARQACEQRSI